MDDEVHIAGLVEEALQHHGVLRGDDAQRRLRRGEVVDQLLRRGGRQQQAVTQPGRRALDTVV